MRVVYRLIVLSTLCLAVLADSVQYAYDSLNRIVRAAYSSGTVIVYTYDAAGNRLSQVISNPATALPGISLDSTTLTYDAYVGQGDPKPQFLSISNSGGGTLNWLLNPADNWVTITSGATVAGGGIVSYAVTTNNGLQRIGSISVGGQTSTITQQPKGSGPNFVFSIDQPNASVCNGSGTFIPVTGSFTLTATNCTPQDTWIAASSSPRLWITSDASGNGSVASTTISYAMFTNTTTLSRTATISLAGQTFTVVQQGSIEPQPNRVVRALYQSILGREPDQPGYQSWTGAGAPQDSYGVVLVNQMADGFYTSTEFQSVGWATLSVYQTVLGRPPSFEEWTPVIAQLRNGSFSIPQLLSKLTASAEYQANAGGPVTSANFVQQVFQNGYGRLATAAEENTFTTQLDSSNSANPRLDFLNNTIFESIEFKARTNPAFVTMLYYTILQRDPDFVGFQLIRLDEMLTAFAAWQQSVTNPPGSGLYYILPQPGAPYGIKLAIIGQAVPPSDVVPGFLGSAEFQALVQ